MYNAIMFLKSGKKVSMCQKLGYEYRLLSSLNFPGVAILNFYDPPLLLPMEQPYYVTKIQSGGDREI